MAVLQDPGTRTSIVLVDDHEHLRAAVSELLELDQFDVVGQAANGADGLAAVVDRQPGLAVLDLELPDTNGIELARAIAPLAPSTGLVLYTASGSPRLERQAKLAGILAVVYKGGPPAELIRVLGDLVAELALGSGATNNL